MKKAKGDIVAEHDSIVTVRILSCTKDLVKLQKANSLAVDSNQGTNWNDPPKPWGTKCQFLCWAGLNGTALVSAVQLCDSCLNWLILTGNFLPKFGHHWRNMVLFPLMALLQLKEKSLWSLSVFFCWLMMWKHSTQLSPIIYFDDDSA